MSTPATESPNIETREFSPAEISRLKAKAETANQAIAEYNDWLDFLRQQHEAKEEEGWQLGAQGFVRPVAGNPPASLPSGGSQSHEGPNARASKKPAKAAKNQAPAPTPNGDGSQEPVREAVHQNGAVPEKEAAALA